MSREDWEFFDEIKKERKAKREARRLEWPEIAASHHLTWVKHHDTHWSCILLGDRLEYWPGPKRWRWRDKNSTGDVIQFIAARERN